MSWLLRASLVTTLLGACGGSSSDMPAPTPPAPADSARYLDDVTAVTGVRTPNTPKWQEVQDLCATRFEEMGFSVERHTYATGTNVIGVLPGTSKPDERVYISAHYDSTPNCSGADDNASGVAGVFEAARVLTARPHARTLVVACWDQEEAGLVGSRAWVKERALPDGETIVGNFVFEMIGYHSDQPNTQMSDPQIAAVYPDAAAEIENNMFRGDFILVIHDLQSTDAVADFVATAGELSLKTLVFDVDDLLKKSQFAGALRRSDHAVFWDEDLPGIQLTDTANYRNPHYHCGSGPDEVVDLDIDFATNIVTSTARAAAKLLDK